MAKILWRCALAAVLCAPLLVSAPGHPAQARPRGPRVEVTCPTPPSAAAIGGRRVLVYELHVTNFDTSALTLQRLEVYGQAAGGQPLRTLPAGELATSMMEPGAGAKGPPVIERGQRAVIFLWIEEPAGAADPAVLRHRLVFAGDPAAGAEAQSVLEGFEVAVRKAAPLHLSPPFRGGTWLAGDAPGNDSTHRRSLVAIDGGLHDAQRFAIDWVKVGPNGDSHRDGTARNESWWGYGEPVLAVADGEVTEVVNGIAENTPRVLPSPVTLDNIGGNYVTLRIAPDRYVTYAHLQTGSISVRVGQRVKRGTVLARLGNTGQATGPHLHLQVTDRNSLLQSEGVPYDFKAFTDLGPGSAYEADKHASTPRTNTLGGKDEVVAFDAGGASVRRFREDRSAGHETSARRRGLSAGRGGPPREQ